MREPTGAGDGLACIGPTASTTLATRAASPAMTSNSRFDRWLTRPTLRPDGLKMPIWAPTYRVESKERVATSRGPAVPERPTEHIASSSSSSSQDSSL